MSFRAIALLALLVSPALAQPMPPEDLQRLLAVMESQRNAAGNQHAFAEMRAAKLADDLAKANARISELEKKLGEATPLPPARPSTTGSSP